MGIDHYEKEISSRPPSPAIIKLKNGDGIEYDLVHSGA
jgi:hypothetical protein